MLLNEDKYAFNLYFSKQDLEGIRSYIPPREYKNMHKIQFLKNYFINNILIWQSGVLKRVMFKNFDFAFFMGDMSVISTWIAAIICRIRKKKVIFWGHGIYGNENFLKLRLRLLFLKMANINLLYGERAKIKLNKFGFSNKNIWVIYNSLDYDEHLRLYNNLKRGSKKNSDFLSKKNPTVLFIGRLTQKKKIDILIKSLAILKGKNEIINLKVIGEGPAKKMLVSLAKKHLESKNFNFFGSVYHESRLSELIYNSDICISPGNIGLTAIHSLSYGTPIASHSNFDNQMPEVESIIVDQNGFLFEENNENDLANKILYWLNKGKVNKENIRSIVDEKYNPYYQKKIIDQLIING